LYHKNNTRISFRPYVCYLLLTKNLTSCTSRDTNLSKTTWKTTVKAPSRTPQEPEDPAPYNAPCQQEAVKETDASPQFLILSPIFIITKEKWGNDRTIKPPFYKSAASLSSGLTSWKMEPFPVNSPFL
jgi:hypothetical protein